MLLGALGPGIAAASDPQPAELPTYAAGDKWIRSDGLYEMVRVEDGQYVFTAGKGRIVRLSRTLGPAAVVRGQGTMSFSPPFELKWPLRIGERTTTHGTWHVPPRPDRGRPDALDLPATLVAHVVGWEDVTVTAGTVGAYRIEFMAGVVPRGDRSGFQAGARLHFEGWYAPSVRQYVKVASREAPLLGFETVAFDQPAGGPLEMVVEAPRDHAQVADESLPVRVTLRSSRGVRRVAVSVNGAEVAARDEPAPKPELALNQPVKLREGRNVVLVTATEADGTTRQESRVVTYQRPAPVVVAAAPTTRAIPPPASAAPPLTVALSSPADHARVPQEGVALAGVVSGGRGISRVTVTLNGAEVTRRDETPAARAVPLNLPITLREGQNTLVVTATDVDGAVQQEVRAIEFARQTPLGVAVRYPEDRARVSEDSSVVAAVVTSSKGVAKVSVSLNGTEISQQTERTPPTSLAVSVPLTLRPGPNAIVVTATETDGTTRQEMRTITYEAPKVAVATTPASPPPPAPAPPPSNRWAVVIGIGQYDNGTIPHLKYTVPDAEAVYAALLDNAGFKKENVLLLTDRSDKKPTLRNIKWALGTFLGRSAQKDDTVLIFFAGHGAPEVDTRGLERDGLAKYLIPSDADPDDLYSTALPMDELQTIFARIEAERVVAFLDACYSGAVSGPGLGRTFASKRTRAGSLDDLFLERLTRSKGRAIVTASRPSEVSIELPELAHGIFTYYLVSGLKGAADLNHDGIVTLQELYEYLDQQVSTKSRAVGGNQHPVMKGDLEGVLPLAKVGAGK
jgi:hypothetical protein